MVDDLHVHILALRRYANVLCRNRVDADDLVQETLLKAIAASSSFRAGSSLRVWLFSILHNTFVSHRRQYARRARAAAFLATLFQDRSTPPVQEHHVEAGQTLHMLAQLTPEQQSALTLIGVEGMSYEEAATVLDIPVGTLMSRLARGREQLRLLMANNQAERLRSAR